MAWWSVLKSPRPSNQPERSRLAKRRPHSRPALESLEHRNLLSVNVGTNFVGMSYNDTSCGCEPPDTIAAAGPNHVVEMINTAIRITDKAGTTLSTQELSSFFAPLSPNSLSDPSVMFDDTITNSSGPAGRFIVGILDFTNTTSNFDFAVSNDADPTHGFTEMHKVNMAEGHGYFADYPREGWNADGYFFSFNMFTSIVGSYDHVQLLTVSKSTVTDANNSTFTKFAVDRDATNFTMAPATMHGATSGGPEWFVEEAPTANAIRVVKMTNVLSSSPTFTETNLGVTAYGAPPMHLSREAARLPPTTRGC